MFLEIDFCVAELSVKEATFHGSDYVTYRMPGDDVVSLSDRVSLRFKTQQRDGLLFFTGKSLAPVAPHVLLTVALFDVAGSDTSHVRIWLERGSLRFSYRLDASVTTSTTSPSSDDVSYDDGEWHFVSLRRDVTQVRVALQERSCDGCDESSVKSD